MMGTDSGATVDTGPASVDAAASDAGTDSASAVAPGSPVLTAATLVTHGTMSLTWTLPASGCDTIVVNRKKDAGVYAVAQTVTGVATSAMDMPGHATGMYCYTLVCTLGGMMSAPSNERCVTQ